MDRKFIDRFSLIQDRVCGYSDYDEMDKDEFEQKYPTKKEMKEEAEYWLEMMYGTGRGIGCISAEMRYDDNPAVRKEWQKIVRQVKAFIRACEKENK